MYRINKDSHPAGNGYLVDGFPSIRTNFVENPGDMLKFLLVISIIIQLIAAGIALKEADAAPPLQIARRYRQHRRHLIPAAPWW